MSAESAGDRGEADVVVPAVPVAVSHASLRFALEGGIVTLLASIITTQTVLVVLSWPDLSFWAFGALTSVVVGAALGLTAAAGGLIAWFAGARMLDLRRRSLAVGLAMAVAATAVAAVVTVQGPEPLRWLWWTVPGAAAVGGAFAVRAIRRDAV